METCVDPRDVDAAEQAQTLADAGLDYYNHNLDTSPEYYRQVITSRALPGPARHASPTCAMPGIHVCSGGIVGMGETREDRAGLLQQLANLPEHPESVPINNLVQVEGTPLHGIEPISPARTRALHRRRPHPDADVGRSACPPDVPI